MEVGPSEDPCYALMPVAGFHDSHVLPEPTSSAGCSSAPRVPADVDTGSSTSGSLGVHRLPSFVVGIEGVALNPNRK